MKLREPELGAYPVWAQSETPHRRPGRLHTSIPKQELGDLWCGIKILVVVLYQLTFLQGTIPLHIITLVVFGGMVFFVPDVCKILFLKNQLHAG